MRNLGKLRMGLGLGAAISFLGALGCEAQVGDEYTGEVMLTLRGHVDAPPETRTDLEPALVFFVNGPVMPDGSYSHHTEIVRGKIDGVFPADFQLTIAEPPPSYDPAQGVLNGYIALVPRDFPSRIESPTIIGLEHEISDDPAVPSRSRAAFCLDTGACRERVYECFESVPCPVLELTGDPESATSGPGLDVNGWGNLTAYKAEARYCGGTKSCYREIRRCNLPDAREMSSGWDVQSCSITSDTGDESVKILNDIGFAVSNLSVAYMTADADEASSAKLRSKGGKPGYNVIEKPRAATDADFIAYANCSFDVREEVLAETNAETGTSHTFDSLPDFAGFYAESEQRIDETCGGDRVVTDTASVPLQLDLRSGVSGE